MTIAIGFLCKDGVLLSADTEVGDGYTKTYQNKITHFRFDGGAVAFACAGAGTPAVTAIHAVKSAVASGHIDNPLEAISQILENEYRRQVLGQPSALRDRDYRFLMALWTPGDRARLYVTEEVSVCPVKGSEALGVGSIVAKALLQNSPLTESIPPALRMSAYVLSCVKSVAQNCGGDSVHVTLTNEGELGLLTSFDDGPCRDLQLYAPVFNLLTQQLLLWMANDTSDDDFRSNLMDNFAYKVHQKRCEWTRARLERERQFAEQNSHLPKWELARALYRMSIGLSPVPPIPPMPPMPTE